MPGLPLLGAKNILVEPCPDSDFSPLGLRLTIDPAKELGPSSSGKTTLIATSGSKPLGKSNLALGCNLYYKNKPTVEVVPVTKVGTNLQYQITDDKLIVIDVDLQNADAMDKVSGSGKNILLATSSGNRQIGKTGITLGLNGYVKVGQKFSSEGLKNYFDGAAAGTTSSGCFLFRTQDEEGEGGGLEKALVISCDIASANVSKAGEKFDTGGFFPVPVEGVTASVNLQLVGEFTAPKPADDGEDNNNNEGEEEKTAKFKVLAGTKNIEWRYLTKTAMLEFKCLLSREFGESASGKSLVVASSSFAKQLPGTVFKPNVNVMKKNPNAPKPDEANDSSTPPAESKKKQAKPTKKSRQQEEEEDDEDSPEPEHVVTEEEKSKVKDLVLGYLSPMSREELAVIKAKDVVHHLTSFDIPVNEVPAIKQHMREVIVSFMTQKQERDGDGEEKKEKPAPAATADGGDSPHAKKHRTESLHKGSTSAPKDDAPTDP